MPAKKRAAKPLNESAKASEPGPIEGSSIYLDPALAEIREQEKARNSAQVTPRAEPTIDPRLLEIREAELKRGYRVL